MTEQKTKKTRSLAFVLATGFLALSLTALIIASIPQGILFFQAELNRIKAEQNVIADDAANQVSNFVQEKFSSLELSARLVEPGNYSQEEQVSVLTHLLAMHPSYRSVILLDTNGRELAHSTRFSQAEVDILLQQAEAVQFTVLNGEARYISPVYINESTSEPLITIAVPVQNLLGDLQGILLAEVNLKFMWDLVGGIQVGETGSAFVVNTNGVLLAHRDISRVLARENLSQMEVVDQFLNGSVPPGGSVFSNNENLNGTRGIVTLVNIGVPNWAVMTFLPTVEGIQGLLNNFAILLGIVLVLVGLIAWVSVFLARRLSAPLVDLSTIASEVAGGNLSVSTKITGPTEIAQVASTFNEMTSRLRELITTLEQRVADRTKALATSAEVTRHLAAILEPGQLASEVVNEVRDAFDYYYAQIYLLDETGENLVIAGGTGNAGDAMLARGHSLPKGRGLVGRAADANASVLVSDVSQEEGWLPNELLPETKAEAAIPISIGNQVMGVLDVQHNLVGGLTHEDVILLESLAGQVAISLRNARSYEHTRSQAELQALVNVIGQKIQRTTSVEDTLQTATRELGTAIGASRVKASLRSASSAISTAPVALADSPVAVIEGEEGAFDPEGTLADDQQNLPGVAK